MVVRHERMRYREVNTGLFDLRIRVKVLRAYTTNLITVISRSSSSEIIALNLYVVTTTTDHV